VGANPIGIVLAARLVRSDVALEDADGLLHAWADDAAFMKRQPGFISTQLHRGIARSTTFINVAIWESAAALGQAANSPEFQTRVSHYPNSTVAAPHVFEKIAVPGICVSSRTRASRANHVAASG
jgi:heme-degrading monooxygenase HmoA